MSTELENFIASLRGSTADIRGVNERMKALEKEKALQSAYEMTPELVERGDMIGAGAQLAQAGDPAVLRDMLQQQYKAQMTAQKSGPSIDPGLITKQYGLNDADKAIIASSSDPLQTAKELASVRNQQGQLNINYDTQKRLVRKEAGVAQDWFKETKKLQSTFVEQDKLFKNVRDALSKGTQPADALVLNFIARNIAGEKGPLAEGDIARLKGKYAEEDWNKVNQYINSGGKSTLTPEQRQAYKDIVQTASDNYDAYKTEMIGNQLADATRFEGSLFDPDTGKLDKRAQKYFSDFGFEVEKMPEGYFTAVKKSQKREVIDDNAKSAVSGTGGGQGSQEEQIQQKAQTRIDAIKDQELKKAVLDLIKNRPAEQVEIILKNAGV